MAFIHCSCQLPIIKVDLGSALLTQFSVKNIADEQLFLIGLSLVVGYAASEYVMLQYRW